MATPTLVNTPTVLDMAEATTDWNGDSFDLEPDVKVQGSNSIACTMTNNGTNDVYVDGFTAVDLSTEHIRLWFNISFASYLASTNAIQVFISDGSNTAYWTMQDADKYAGGWAQAVVYTGNTPTSGTKPTGNTTRVGMRFNTSSKPRNVPANAWFDAWYYGDGYTAYGGTSGDEITLAEIATVDKTNAYGIVSEVDGVFFLAGDIQIGDGTNTTYFKDEGDIAVFKNLSVSSTLYGLTFYDDASNVTNIDISGGAYSCAGSQRPTFDASISDLNSFGMSGKQISSFGVIDFASGQDILNNVFDNCGQVDPSTCTFENNSLSNYVGSEGGALLWPGGTTVKSCNFIDNLKSIEITQTTNQTYDALIFTGEDNSTKQSTHLNNGGTSINVSKNNGTNAQYYVATGGGVVTFVGSSVSVTVTVTNVGGTDIQDALVLLVATGAGGGLPVDDTVTIVNSGTTATVSHTAHGMASGDKIQVTGASLTANNGVFVITLDGTTPADKYSYTMLSTPGSSPTGTIKVDYVALYGMTDVDGEITDSRVYATAVPLTGRVRKSSGVPYYKTSPLIGEISTTTGFTGSAVMVGDS